MSDTTKRKGVAGLDEVIAEALSNAETMFRDLGASDAEIAANMERTRADLAAWRVDALAEVARFVDEPNAPTTRLQ